MGGGKGRPAAGVGPFGTAQLPPRKERHRGLCAARDRRVRRTYRRERRIVLHDGLVGRLGHRGLHGNRGAWEGAPRARCLGRSRRVGRGVGGDGRCNGKGVRSARRGHRLGRDGARLAAAGAAATDSSLAKAAGSVAANRNRSDEDAGQPPARCVWANARTRREDRRRGGSEGWARRSGTRARRGGWRAADGFFAGGFWSGARGGRVGRWEGEGRGEGRGGREGEKPTGGDGRAAQTARWRLDLRLAGGVRGWRPAFLTEHSRRMR